MARITLDTIKEELTPEGWKVISDSYKTLDTEMAFECPEGHQVYSTWKKIRTKRDCPLCRKNQVAEVSANDIVVPKPKNVRRVLALDQASHTTGYAIFDDGALVKYGVFKCPDGDEEKRFFAVRAWLISLIQNWGIDYIGMEGIQYQDESAGHRMGITVFQTLARLQGVLMLTCYEQEVPFTICHTGTWRHAIGVKGKTRIDRKRSMQMIAKQQYDITISDDEADAIGIGLYLTTKIVSPAPKLMNWET